MPKIRWEILCKPVYVIMWVLTGFLGTRWLERFRGEILYFVLPSVRVRSPKLFGRDWRRVVGWVMLCMAYKHRIK